MLIEAGGLDGHANVTQSPAVFLWNLHFLQVRFYPPEKDQVMGDQVMQFRNLSRKNALTVKDIVQAPFLFLGIRRIHEQIKAAGLDQEGIDIAPRMGVE